MTEVDAFHINGTSWRACEDLQQPGGALALFSGAGDAEWFEKDYAPYRTNWTDDSDYYLGLGKVAVASAATDILGTTLLQQTGGALSWVAVERAVPPMRVASRGGGCRTNCKGVRTFVGSRSASVDTTMDNHGGGTCVRSIP